MFFYIGALVLGLLRWPWWAVPILALVKCLWVYFIDVPALRNLIPSGDRPPISFGDEMVLLPLGVSIFVMVVAYVLGLGGRALWNGAKRT